MVVCVCFRRVHVCLVRAVCIVCRVAGSYRARMGVFFCVCGSGRGGGGNVRYIGAIKAVRGETVTAETDLSTLDAIQV